ncbi:MAG: DUF2189 domain-containing protein [Gammaproteobacteria bacterium]
MNEKHRTGPVDPAALPFAAPCRILTWEAPWRWLRLGWQDLRRAPRQSLTYGAVMVALSYAISLLAVWFGDLAFLLSLISGFIFLGPVLAIGLYSISRQLQLGREPELGYCLREGWRHLGNELVFAVILLVVFLVWARAASMVHVFFPMEARPELADLVPFLGVGTLVGAIFSAVVFCASALSLPMIMDRKADVVTAVVSSVNAVLRNKWVMLEWAVIILGAVLLGFATAFLGLAVLLPLIGHATWHAYQETLDTSAWQRHEVLTGGVSSGA